MTRPSSLTLRRGAIAAAVALAGGWWGATVGAADSYGEVDECLRQEVQAEGMPGAALAIGLGGRVVHTLTVGVKHKELGGAVDDETLFQIGSITKMMTAAAVMQQVEAGTVDLDAAVTTYIPELEVGGPWGADLITIRHLLTHTSAFPDNWGPMDRRSPREWVADARRLSLEAVPGSFFNYSNPGFSLAGHVVERVTGTDYTAYMGQRLWRPAGLKLTTVDPEEVLAHGNYAYGHSGRARVAPPDSHPPFALPAGFAFSTPRELVKWAAGLMDGGAGFLAPESAAAMQSPQIGVATVPWVHYGFGIFVSDWQRVGRPEERVRVLSHGGAVNGFRSYLMWVPQQSLAVAAMNNSADNSLDATLVCAMRAVAGLEPPSVAGLTTDPATWQRYSGTYALLDSRGLTWTVRVDGAGGELRAVEQSRGQFGSTDTLRQMYLDTFRYEGRSTTVTFIGAPRGADTVAWMRNRRFVGMHVGDFPAAVALRGPACGAAVFTPRIDMSVRAKAYGLVAVDSSVGVAIGQDDRADPAKASFKRRVRLTTESPLFAVKTTARVGDVLRLYIMGDADGDGEFEYPGEVVAQDISATAEKVLLAPSVLPPGDYQVWVQGYNVRGSDSTFDLELEALHGTDLRVAGVPRAIEAGREYHMEVCAATSGAALGERYGMVVLDYGYAPRSIMVPVTWRPWPAGVPTPAATPVGGQSRVLLPDVRAGGQ